MGTALSFPFSGGSEGEPLVADTASSTQSLPPPPSTFIEIINSCDAYYEGTCAHAYVSPSASSSVTATLRSGMVLKVATTSEEGGEVWYSVAFDDWIRYPSRIRDAWYIRSDSARVFESIASEELPETGPASTTKHIIVDRSEQTLYAYDGDTLAMTLKISTGLALTPTPRGTFTIYRKTPSRYMQGPLPGISDQYYDLPGVPWNLYFTHEGAVIHGAHWHDHFGTPWSHGCVNVSLSDARTLYEWADVGTEVTVQD